MLTVSDFLAPLVAFFFFFFFFAVLLFVYSLSHVQLFVTPWTAAYQAPWSSTVSQSLLRFMFVELVMLPNHFTLGFPLLLLPSIFPSIGVFSSELTFRFRWSKVLGLQPQYQTFQWIFRVDFL